MNVDKDIFLGKKIFSIKKILKEKKRNSFKFIIKKPPYFKAHNLLDSHIKKSQNEGRWSNEEHCKFLEGLELYGVKWKKYRNIIESRTLSQVRSHAQKFFLKMKLCKDENLGIDFTSNSIRNIGDMINQIKNNKNNNNIINIFKYLNDKYENNFKSTKRINIDDNIKNDINRNVNTVDDNNIELNYKDFNYNFINNNYIYNINFSEEELSLKDDFNSPNQFLKQLNIGLGFY